jgi:hypothetical protein
MRLLSDEYSQAASDVEIRRDAEFEGRDARATRDAAVQRSLSVVVPCLAAFALAVQ